MDIILENKFGLTHIYCGDGKGKTTAAIGLAVRAAGSGKKILIVQFLKNGKSSELISMADIPNIKIFTGNDVEGYTFSMDDEMRKKVYDGHSRKLAEAIEFCINSNYDMLVLDEIVGAISTELIDYNALINFVRNKPDSLELVLTGRDPGKELLALSDYISNIQCVKHPYEKGMLARRGIEY